MWSGAQWVKGPDKLQLYGLYVYYVVHICDFGMLRVKALIAWRDSNILCS